MKKKYVVGIVILILMVLALVPAASGQSATSAPWTSSITYYTPSSTGGDMLVSYYAEGNATAVDTVQVTLAPHAAGSIYIGATGVPPGFNGAAVLSAQVPVIATSVNFAGEGQAGQYGRPLYSGFAPEQASSDFFIPTVLNQRFGSTSTIGIQNVTSGDVTATVKIYAEGSTTPTATKNYTIKSQSSVIVTAAELGAPAGFSGSATIEATGDVVASALETDDAGRGAYAFEGVSGGSETVNMATMICNAFSGQISYYAIQNGSLSDTARYTIDFYNTAGAKIATKSAANLGPGAKVSINPCDYNVPAGTSGSAVIRGQAGDSLVAIGKVKAPNGIATAWTGQSAGDKNAAAAYVRWSANEFDEFRAYIAIMNVGTGPATGCKVIYYDANGNGKTENLPNFNQFIKVNSNAAQANALSNGDFGTNKTAAGVGGAIEVECNQEVIVLTRLTKSVNLGATTKFGEDYTASPTQ